ncbi:MAG: cytochrome C oxidase subunit IV family protein [Proteobacteria bacterium]|nr:cytochrome C oxidase subunit IV family protein [Pseudomonadota bacterium]MBU1389934.1 cytochrome C oxidase subunit IV family protein [Pseudomonadota bacterium]MBU1542533.1 cytochrome C oxidase subunit IV family protein [Pseudomonadota bacterium]MBU2479702.1 cytochrome C oxidase subunit IV family protein [Pseudomonadota bacterium]
MEKKPDTHIFDYKTLAAVLCGLLILTAITVGVSCVDFGKLNVWIALFIASLKGSLVLLFFMHLKYESRVLVYSFLSTLFFLGIMISFMFWDVGFR